MTDIIHPPTYLNKILVVGESELQLFNFVNGQLIYNFKKSLEKYIQTTF